MKGFATFVIAFAFLLAMYWLANPSNDPAFWAIRFWLGMTLVLYSAERFQEAWLR